MRRFGFSRSTAVVGILGVLVASTVPAGAFVQEHLPVEAGSTNAPYVVEAGLGGEVYEFGEAEFLGSLSGIDQPSEAVDLVPTSTGDGYWIAAGDGSVRSFGDAGVASVAVPGGLDQVVAMTARPKGAGFWLVTAAGRVVARGGAVGYGGLGDPATSPVVAIEATSTGRGYWLLRSDGAVSAFGDALALGSAEDPEREYIDLVRAPSAIGGYWIVDERGAVTAFGAAPKLAPVEASLDAGDRIIGGTASGADGLWLASAHGRVLALGSAPPHSGARTGPDEPIVAIAASPGGEGFWLLSGPGRSWLGPQPPDHEGDGQRIVYALAEQRIWLINEDDTVFDSYLVSGKAGTPRPGDYAVYSKSRNAFAAHDGITMDHMVRFARGKTLAIGFHSIPIYRNGQPMQTPEQLGTYRSAGCVRQRNDQAERLYNWAPLGTPVHVTA